MRMKKYWRIAGLLVFIGLTSINWSPEELERVIEDAAKVKGSGTMIVGNLDEALPAGKNVLWCATLQMAWDEAGARLGPLKLEPKSTLGMALNQRPFDLKWIDPASCSVIAGSIGEGVLGKIDARTRKRSGQGSKLLDQLSRNSSPDDLVFHALLHKDLKFQSRFGKLGSWKVGDHPVRWFGFSPKQQDTAELLDQVRVHHYGDKNDFVVELLTKGGGDQLILAKLPAQPRSTQAISKSILAHLQASPPRAAPNDLLAVPNVVANEQTSFSQLEGHKVVGSNRVIRRALQSIDFSMDEKGVVLHSEAAISFACAASPNTPPRLLVLSPPFALIMLRKGAPQPYFIAWFANADLLSNK